MTVHSKMKRIISYFYLYKCRRYKKNSGEQILRFGTSKLFFFKYQQHFLLYLKKNLVEICENKNNIQ